MRFVKKTLLTLFGLIIAAIAVGVLLPSSVHVERSVTVAAPPDKVFAVLNDYKHFNRWSPWFGKDPDADYRTQGPATGVGAKFIWNSEVPEVGSGSQEIIATQPGRSITVHLDFGGQGTATSVFDIAPVPDGSRVTWQLDTAFGYDLIGRYLGLFFDGMIGPDYEAGLANLKRYLEDS